MSGIVRIHLSFYLFLFGNHSSNVRVKDTGNYWPKKEYILNYDKRLFSSYIIHVLIEIYCDNDIIKIGLMLSNICELKNN